MIFHFSYFKEKLMIKSSSTNKKNTISTYLGPIFPILRQNKIFLKILFLPVFFNSESASLSQIKRKKKWMSWFQARVSNLVNLY